MKMVAATKLVEKIVSLEAENAALRELAALAGQAIA
jgi:hypothetical protein